MRQIKIFKSLEYDYFALEGKVNKWIENEGIEVVDVKVQLSPQSPSATPEVLGENEQSDLLLLVTYEK